MGHKCDGCRYKGEHQEMMFRPFGVCTKELNLIDAEKAYNADKCPYKKTNADRIRAMSDEELAELIVKHKPLYSWPKAVREIWMQPKVTKIQAWVMWLKQPAEGELPC